CPYDLQLARSVEELACPAGAPPEQRAVGDLVGPRTRKGKEWPLATAAAVLARLRADGLHPVVFIGPDEAAREAEIRSALALARFVREPDVRRVAALLARCVAVVTPDAGPMHLAIAAGAPTVAIFRKANADRWGPRPPHGEAIVDPDGRAVEPVVAALHRWSAARRAAL